MYQFIPLCALSMLKLDDSLYFAKGYSRSCYVHPSDQNLCVKISLTDNPRRIKGITKGIIRENKYYKTLQKRAINWSQLSQYSGDIETTLGLGSVYQLIRDEDDAISQSLEKYFFTPGFIIENQKKIIDALCQLYLYMQENRILTTSLLPRNIVVAIHENKFKLVIIDDIGNSEFVPFSSFIPCLSHKKIQRKWLKMLSFIEKKHPDLPASFKSDLHNALDKLFK